MSQVLQDVFTIEEVARAARVPRQLVQDLINSGDARLIAGTPFMSATDAVCLGRRLRAEVSQPAAVAYPFVASAPEPLFATVAGSSGFALRRSGIHTLASSLVHATIVVAMLWWTAGSPETAPEPPEERARLVFLMTPG